MSETASIAATPRPLATKGAVRAIRRAGQVPAIIYGGGEAPEPIAIDMRAVTRAIAHGRFTSTIFNIEVDGRKLRVLPRDVQLDPVTDWPLHVDFMRIAKGARVRVMVPVVFVGQGTSPGLKRGGVINIVRHEIECFCPSEAIPEHLTADLSDCDIGDSVHISKVALPTGVTPVITGRDFTIVTVAAPTIAVEAEAAPAAAEAAAAEGEKKPEEGAAKAS